MTDEALLVRIVWVSVYYAVMWFVLEKVYPSTLRGAEPCGEETPPLVAPVRSEAVPRYTDACSEILAALNEQEETVKGCSSRHHRRPRSRGGSDEKRNISLVKQKSHAAWHTLFGNQEPEAIAETINSVWLDPDWELVAVRRSN